MTLREWVDAALVHAMHKNSDSPDFVQWSQRATLFGQQVLEYAHGYDDWDFNHANGTLAVTANLGRIAGPSDISIEGPNGGIFVNDQQQEIKWISARELFQIRELEARSGGYPEFYTVAEQTSTYLPYIYFDRESHDAFTGNIYYLKTRPTLNYVKAPGAATAALAAPAAPGNVENGTHSYKVTFVTAGGETEGGTTSNVVTVTDKTVNGQISLTAIPVASLSTGVSTPSLVTSRKLYRTAAGGTQHKLLATLSDNTTTTYTDNIADASLTTNVPTTDTTGEDLKKFPSEYHRSVLLPGLIWRLRANVKDPNAAEEFQLFTTALARMSERRIFGLQEDERVRGYSGMGMW